MSYALFTVPRPFVPPFAVIQYNALRSWARLKSPGGLSEVILVGSELGVAEAARELGLRHLPQLVSDSSGRPLLSSAFSQVHAAAADPYLCFTNCDIILGDDFASAANEVTRSGEPLLMVGQCWDITGLGAISFEASDWNQQLRKHVLQAGRPRGDVSLDYHLYRREMYTPIPPFRIGGSLWDEWIVREALQRNIPVVDASTSVFAVHQSLPPGQPGVVPAASRTFGVSIPISDGLERRTFCFRMAAVMPATA